MRTEFGLLGPLQVQSGSLVLRIPAARQRVILAALAARARQALSFDDLAHALWDDTPPARARETVRNYVSRLRQELGPVGHQIVTRAPGYLLEAADDDVDLLAFTRLCRLGGTAVRAGHWQRCWDVLAGALQLWRGMPLADVPSRPLRDEHLPVLESLRLQAVEWRLEAGLHLGRHDELVPELQRQTAEQPLRERLRAHLMLALYRCGRQAEALAVYRDCRRTLVDQLGVEPAPELQELNHRILAGDAALMVEPEPPGAGRLGPAPDAEAVTLAPGEPHQLPVRLRHFVGRRAELSTLSRLLDEAGQQGSGTVVAIVGSPGVGKTTLAVHWAHEVAARFPDGQLHMDLRGFSPSGPPLRSEAALRDFLQALGTPPERVPASAAAQAALYRTLAAGKRLLILLDNAHDAAQVRPLLPGSPGCLVLVTSRADLAGLAAAEGAWLLTLGPPGVSEARDLLARRLGNHPMATEPQAADELIRLCARLPLALSIVAARAAARPGFPLSVLAAELDDAGGRLDALDVGDAASSVRAVFSWSYRQLGPAAARMFRLFGVHPGPEVSATAAASLAGLALPAARAALRELSQASLIAEHAPGRYGLHDLLHVYAAELAGPEKAAESGAECRAAAYRMLDHYLHSADIAARALDPVQEKTVRGRPAPGVTLEPITGRAQALAWFEAEHKVLLAVAGYAAGAGYEVHARQLPSAMVTFLDRNGHWHDLAALQLAALECAQRLGDREGQARAHRNLGRAHLRLGETGRALAHLRHAVALFQELGDQVGEGRTHLTVGAVFHHEGELGKSLASGLRALDLAEAAGNPVLRAMACNNVGYCHAVLGDLRQGLSYCQRALADHRLIGAPSSLEATIWDSLGYVHQRLGHYRQAVQSYQRALGLFEVLGARYLAAKTLTDLGDAHRAAGNTQACRDAWQQALAVLCDMNHPDYTAVRAKLAEVDQAARRVPAS